MFLISYRRDDTQQITGRIYDRVRDYFGGDMVFRDHDSIPAGVDFSLHIEQALRSCVAVIAIIGPNWVGRTSSGGRRIDEESDFVRIEVGQALSMQIPVIPVLIDGTKMPTPDGLPADLRNLASFNAIPVDSGIDFDHHIDRLCSGMGRLASPRQAPAAPGAGHSGPGSPSGIPPFSVQPYLGLIDAFRNIQKALIKEDILHDYPDGVLGFNTMRAVVGFQQKYHLTTGGLDEETVDSLFDWESRPESPINQKDPDLMRRYLRKPVFKHLSGQIRWIQETLRRSKCYAGPIDGIVTTNMLDSVREFQAQKRAEQDGCIGYETLLLAIEDEVNRRDLLSRTGSTQAPNS